jgi:hypothetical protein
MMAPYDPDKHHRRSIRLKGYDYTIRDYIQTNPSRWIDDQLHPQALPNELNRE